MNYKRLFIYLVILVFLFNAPPALAHANLVRSDPPANSAQKVSPTRVRLWFSEDVEPSFTTVSVLNTAGVPLDKGDSQRVPDDAKAMEVSVTELPLGLYTVAWKALSAVDGHATSGSFAFAVGDVPPAESSPREVMALVDSALSASAPPPLYEPVSRGFNLFALIALVGSLLFPLLVLLPAIRVAQTQNLNQLDVARAAWTRRWLNTLWVGFIVYAVATVGLLIAQSVSAGGLPTIARVLTGTRFGAIWLARVVMLIALGVVIAVSRRRWLDEFRLGRSLFVAFALAIALLVTQSLNSHGAAITDPPFVALGVDFIHLLCTAIWLGGLIQLVLTVPTLLKSLASAQQTSMLAVIVARFSLVAFVTVNVLLATGVLAMVAQVGSLEALFATLYGTSLLIKISLIGLALAVAAFNLIVVRPSLRTATAQRAVVLARQFRGATMVETALAVAILLVVGLLTSVAPARNAYDPSPKLVMQTQHVDDLIVTLGIAPGLVGTNDLDVKVRDAAGQPVSDATVVRLLSTMVEMDMGTQETTATAQGDGHYTLRGDLLSMVGNWNLEALVRRAARDDARTTFALLALDEHTEQPISPLPLALQQTETLVGLALALLGFVGGTASVMIGRWRTRERRVALLAAIGVSLLGTLVVLHSPTMAAPPAISGANLSVPESARFVRSPIAPTADNIAAGRQIYQTNCSVCHGPAGKGNGPLAATLNPRPVDLTVHARLHTEGEFFYWVSNGIPGSAMPKWDAQYNEAQRWQVVAFVRTFALPAPTPAKTNAP